MIISREGSDNESTNFIAFTVCLISVNSSVRLI